MFVVPLVLASRAVAAPVLWRRDDSSGSAKAYYYIWVPVVVVILAIIFIGFLLVYRKASREPTSANAATRPSWFRRLISDSSTSTTNVREVTAEQLAGSGACSQAAPESAPSGNRARRTRRTRRTPSQISTKSLPAYNKEPGDQELVVYRGPDELEDDPVGPTTVIMPRVDEDNSSTEDYPPHPPHDTPLLHDNDHDDDVHTDTVQLPPTVDVSGVDDGATSLAQSGDPRGVAPSYDEAINMPQSEPTSDPGNEESMTRRFSRRSMRGFRNLVQTALGSGDNTATRFPTMPPPEDVPNSHERTDSMTTASESSHTPFIRRHRPTNSFFSFHTASRLSHISRPSRSSRRSQDASSAAGADMQQSTPSLISLNAISPPLAHTLTRTTFEYPKSGPTPEQIKFISSRESLGRFGVPYGEDAVQWQSRSRSRLDVVGDDLSGPPPGWEEVQNMSPEQAARSRSRLASRSQSRLDDTVGHARSGSDESGGSVGSGPAAEAASTLVQPVSSPLVHSSEPIPLAATSVLPTGLVEAAASAQPTDISASTGVPPVSPSPRIIPPGLETPTAADVVIATPPTSQADSSPPTVPPFKSQSLAVTGRPSSRVATRSASGPAAGESLSEFGASASADSRPASRAGALRSDSQMGALSSESRLQQSRSSSRASALRSESRASTRSYMTATEEGMGYATADEGSDDAFESSSERFYSDADGTATEGRRTPTI